MNVRTYSLFSLSFFAVGVFLGSSFVFAGKVEVAVRAVELAKSLDAVGDTGKFFQVAMDRATIEAVTDLRNSNIELGAVQKSVEKALKKDTFMSFSTSLNEAELEELALVLLAPSQSTKTSVNVVQQYLARRYFIDARSAHGALVKGSTMTEASMQKLAATLQARGISANYVPMTQSIPPFGNVTASVRGDAEAKILLEEFKKSNTTVLNSKMGDTNFSSPAEMVQLQKRAREYQAELDRIKAKLAPAKESGNSAKDLPTQPEKTGENTPATSSGVGN